MSLRLFSTGDRIGRFEVDLCVRPGEKRAVYEAHDAEDVDVLAQIVVVPRTSRDVLDAVRVLKAADHPAIPELLHFGVNKDRTGLWLATRMFPGEPLGDRLVRERPDWKAVATCAFDVVQGLQHLHGLGLVHRDVQPQKILIADADARGQLTGFELSRDAEELRTAETPPPLGTLAYSAPEVIVDRTQHQPRSDLYSLGVVLYEALTGQPAFPAALMGDEEEEAARIQRWKSRSDPLDPGEDVPDWLRRLVREMTHPDPERRTTVEAAVDTLAAARDAWELRVDKDKGRPRTDAGIELPPPAILIAAPSIAKAPLPVRPPPPPQRRLIPIPVLAVGFGLAGAAAGIAFAAIVIAVVEIAQVL